MTQDRDHDGGGTGGESSDLFRELLLGLANQIDNLAGMFAVSTDSASGHDLSGDISALLGEIGDLLARLIATLIAVLEAIAKALRSTSADTGPGMPQQYQSIAVRIDPAGGQA